MLAGIKFIPRDQLLSHSSDSDGKGNSRSKKKKKQERRRKKSRRRDSPDDGEGTEGLKIQSERRKKSKKLYSSDDAFPSSSETGSESLSDRDEERKSKRRRRRRREGSSEHFYSSDVDERSEKRRKHGMGNREKRVKGKSIDRQYSSDDDGELNPKNENLVSRKKMGLEWMLPSGSKDKHEKAEDDRKPQVEEVKTVEEMDRTNPNELNPYFKDNGSGYPDDVSLSEAGNHLLSSSVVGDGGISWRLKALKRAKEQAAREGRKLDDVVEERWGSLGQLASSVATRRAAPAHAHLHAIKDRKRGQIEKPEVVTSGEVKGTEEVNRGNHDYLRDVSSRHPEMRKPKRDYVSWKKNKGQNISSEDTSLISSAISGINKYTDDGSFMDNINRLQSIDDGASNSPLHSSTEANKHKENEFDSSTNRKSSELCTGSKQVLSANQLSAKIFQLRMKGKHEEAEKLSKEMDAVTEKQDTDTTTIRRGTEESTSRYIGKQISNERKKKEENADFHLAQKIIQNKQYSMSGRADDEYDYDDAPSRKRHKKREGIPEEKGSIPKGIFTRQDRCQFCFENPSRAKHLVISIGNFTYMMLPQWQPVVLGHCCILTMQHDSATRTVDKNVWEEIRNFKKCLLRMFAKQDKDVVFLETVIGLAKQRRHCLVECIPLPNDLAKEAPMYFKKAIDEAEDEWGQHEMKKVIPTSGNLRNVIPENLSYFHVEFGLDRGFVHVIDDDSNFKSSFGLNVLRGMLRLPEEDMHRRRRHEPVEKQKQAVTSFAKEWEPFDWTRELD